MIGTNKEIILKSSNDFFSELTVVPELGRQMQANTCEFEVSLLYIGKLRLKYVNAIFLFMLLKKKELTQNHYRCFLKFLFYILIIFIYCVCI